ncbi:DUF6671 family protein [Psychroflexus salis]|uniref:DUF6671 domain-containing protein n=1 Tax=Psychroflexus salis TaxID=1526574 RepID=A0A917A463_9FLAO|nr:DUF6671 family protein [Psychroflexus salis]GGE22831.1 hypothetical protein GCM10010831_24670 [Psychroflexus salis]
MFESRRVVIATKHKKEKVIAPILEKGLGVHCFLPEDFDTDILGTFTGEVDRELDPVSTARKKCLMAMELSKCDLGIASEGSFGAHPSLFFANADDEFLIFIDKKNDLEIVVRELSIATNFNGSEINNEQELLEFARIAKFPSHAMILRKSKTNTKAIVKGLTNEKELKKIAEQMLEKYGSFYVETDMRAMYNPSRMMVIEEATKKLVDKINSYCPQCNTPGFGIVEAKKGLECSLCGLPTNSTLSFIYKCIKCSFKKEEMYPHKKRAEDPMYCDFCNP